MLPPMMKVVRVLRTGKRYVFIGEKHRCVETYGRVNNPSASNPLYLAPGMRFLRNQVEILEVERTDALFQELYDQEH
jgi:hypothetical protein